MPEICTDSVCLSLFVFTQLFSEIARCQPAKPARKQNLARNTRTAVTRLPLRQLGFLVQIYLHLLT